MSHIDARSGRGAKPKRRSETTIALIREKAQLQGRVRSDGVREKVLQAMRTIEQEMEANNGIYPKNGGKVSASEVVRRAGIHSTTLYKPKQRALGNELVSWIAQLKEAKVVSRGQVRRKLAERVSDWSEMYAALASSHDATELDLQEARSKLEDALANIERLEQENAQLRQLLKAAGSVASNVTAFPARKG